MEAKYPSVVLSKFSSERCFGLELEFGNKINGYRISDAIAKVDSSREIKISQHYNRDTDNEFWHVKLDHSCGDVEGDYGWELASFKASGIKDINLMGRVTKSICEAGANVNDRCALHVHGEIADFSPAQLAVMCAHWIKIEPYICHMIPAHRADNKYCKFFRHENWVSDSLKDGINLTPKYVWDNVKPAKNDNSGRRKSMNICNFIFTDRKTVEYRFPESTLSDLDVRNWIKLCISFIEKCKVSEMPKDLKVYDFNGFLNFLGFYGRNPFLVLSSGILECKIWLLNRVIKYSRSLDLIDRTKKHLESQGNTEGLVTENCG